MSLDGNEDGEIQMLELVLCDGHKKPCLLKTGLKDGPNYGKSFYICAVGDSRCNFVKNSSVGMSQCSDHPDYPLELQSLHVSRSSQEKRQYYRCSAGRSEKKNWCGYWVVETNVKPAISPLGDHNGKSDKSKSKVDSNKGQKVSVEKADHKVVQKHDHEIKAKDKEQNLEDSFHKWRDPKPSVKEEPNSSKPAVMLKNTMSSTSEKRHGKETPPVAKPKSPSYSKPSAVGELKSIGTKATIKTNPSPDHRKFDETDASDDDCVIIEDSPQKATGLKKLSPVATNSKPTAVKTASSPDGGARPKEKTTQLTQTAKVLPQNSALQNHPISSSGSGGSAQQPVTRVISGQVVNDLVRDMSLKSDLERKLEQRKKTFSMIKVSSLPDGGAKLCTQMDELSEQISKLDIKIKEEKQIVTKETKSSGNNPGQNVFIIKANGPGQHSIHPVGSSSQGAAPVSSQHIKLGHPGTAVKTVSGQVLSGATKQTLITNHVAHLPPHVIQQMYAANPQAMTLYGGRMTKARLQEVGSVTTEALERLHKQLETIPSTEAEVKDPKGLKVPLMTHQRQALAWLSWRENQHPPGGILADDMGLGKTLTMIALVTKQLQRTRSKKKKVPTATLR